MRISSMELHDIRILGKEMVFGEVERVFNPKFRVSDEDDLALVPDMLPAANSRSKQRKPIQ